MFLILNLNGKTLSFMKFERKNTLKDILRSNVKKRIKEKGMNIQGFCKSIGVNRYYIAQLSDCTTLRKLKTIADRLDCTVIDLMEGL